MLGLIAKSKGDKLGLPAAIVAAIGGIVGTVLSYWIFTEVVEEAQAGRHASRLTAPRALEP